jgi:hypothetical protein
VVDETCDGSTLSSIRPLVVQPARALHREEIMLVRRDAGAACSGACVLSGKPVCGLPDGQCATGFCYPPLPTLMIGQLSLIDVARSLSVPFVSSLSTCVSLVIKTGFALDFQVRMVSFQTGE